VAEYSATGRAAPPTLVSSTRQPANTDAGNGDGVRDDSERRAGEDRRRESAVLDEEDRMARELGESVIRGLFGTGLRLQSLRSRVAADVQDEVDSLVTDIDATIREIRHAIFGRSRQGASD
jgi:signal transduction histidine kinase